MQVKFKNKIKFLKKSYNLVNRKIVEVFFFFSKYNKLLSISFGIIFLYY